MTRRAAVLLLVPAALVAGAWAGAATVIVRPSVSEGRVLASFSAPAAFTAEAGTVANSGLLLTFTFTVELRRPASLWLDRTLAVTTVTSSARFDRLAAVYQMTKTQDGRVVRTARLSREAEVGPWMTAFDHVPVPAAAPLERNADYYVRVRLRTSPRPASLWSWARDEGGGRAVFTFIR